MTTGLSITGLGAVTPVGLSAPASAAAFRASIARLGPLVSGELQGPEGEIPAPTGGRVPLEWFSGGPRPEEWPGHERFEVAIPPPEHMLIDEGVERLVRLAVPAALECYRCAIGESRSPKDWGIFLGLSAEEQPGTGQRLVEAVSTALGGFQPALVEVVAQGRAAGLIALHRGAEAIKAGKISGALIGGVDSLIRPAVFKRLTAAGHLKDLENPHGVMAGEAAAFCILEKQPQAGKPLAILANTAIAEEPTAGTDKPNQAQALTTVLRAIRSGASFAHLPLFICDLNGDRYRALEWGLALTRVFGNLQEDTEASASGEFWHPADCIGDTGAASGMVDSIWAVEVLRKRYGQIRHIVVWGASDGAARSAAMITSLN